MLCWEMSCFLQGCEAGLYANCASAMTASTCFGCWDGQRGWSDMCRLICLLGDDTCLGNASQDRLCIGGGHSRVSLVGKVTHSEP